MPVCRYEPMTTRSVVLYQTQTETNDDLIWEVTNLSQCVVLYDCSYIIFLQVGFLCHYPCLNGKIIFKTAVTTLALGRFHKQLKNFNSP